MYVKQVGEIEREIDREREKHPSFYSNVTHEKFISISFDLIINKI